jgi:hypothetical protein
MSDEILQDPRVHPSARPRHLIRLPGFISGEELGLGDVIKRATSTVGIRPCAGCQRRAAALDRWLAFTGRR